jgi:hypothetical protein
MSDRATTNEKKNGLLDTASDAATLALLAPRSTN